MNESFENFNISEGEDSEKDESQRSLDKWMDEVERMTDRLGKEIDPDIREAVAVFNALGFRTEQSCEGHLEERGKPFPWVQIGPETPDKEEWYEDEELREKIKREKAQMAKEMLDLLREFYEDRSVPYDMMLGLWGMGYGFRVQSNFGEVVEAMSEEEVHENFDASREEMNDFVEFLKQKTRI